MKELLNKKEDLWQLTDGDKTTWLSAIGVATKILALTRRCQRGLTQLKVTTATFPHDMGNHQLPKVTFGSLEKKLVTKGRGAIDVLSRKFSCKI